MTDIRAVVLTGAGGNFCSGGDVHEIIGPLVAARARGDAEALLRFTRMTGGLVKAIRGCPQPVIAAVDGVCVGAGAILAMASDVRFGTARSRVAFLFARVGLSGADMGACAILPRIIGQGRASELLFTGRAMAGAEAERIGFFNRLAEPDDVLDRGAAAGPQPGQRPDGGPRHDQAVPGPRVGHESRRGHRDRSQGAGRVHGDRGLRPRLSRLRRQDAGRLRRGLTWPTPATCSWPFFTDAHRRLQSDLRGWRDDELRLQDEGDASAACRDYVAQLGRAGWLRYAVPGVYGSAPTRHSTSARCA